MDGRKNNGAKKGENRGQGRKPKSFEKEVRESIEKALQETGSVITDIWKSTINEAKKGSIAHQTTIYSYYYGKPKETKDLNVEGSLTLPQLILDEGTTDKTE